MSSTKQDQSNSTRIKLGIAGLIVCATCFSSLSFSSTAQAQQQDVIENEEAAMASTVEVALVAGALAAYGWLADKTYDLGKEVGKWLASPQAPNQSLMDNQNADYLLN